MTKQSRAAQIWAALEQRLIEQCGLPNGHMLEVNRPYLIRWIGERLKATPVEMAPTVKSRPNRKAAGALIGPPVTWDMGVKSTLPRRQIDDTTHDPAWAAMLERSCGLRGYQDDEVVTFDAK